jgi:arsenate reductase
MTHPPILVYTYRNCDTCRKATQWLRTRGIPFEERPIRETPPSLAELRAMLGHLGGDRRRLCNTSGADYRAGRLGDRIDALAEEEFLLGLAANGNLVKRPFLIRAGTPSLPALGLTGFHPETWSKVLDRS